MHYRLIVQDVPCNVPRVTLDKHQVPCDPVWEEILQKMAG